MSVFEVKTRVKQGCVMSELLFNPTSDWVRHRNTECEAERIRRTPFFTLDDLDFADDLALISHTHMQVGLKISQKKTEVMTTNVPSPTPVQFDKQDFCSTYKFTYHGSILSVEGGAEKNIKSRLNKARNSFRSMTTVWKSSQYTVNTKIKLQKTCVLPVLLYGSEC